MEVTDANPIWIVISSAGCRQQLQEGTRTCSGRCATMVQERWARSPAALRGRVRRALERAEQLPNGYREREWDHSSRHHRAGRSKLRRGSYFPDWLLEPRRRGGAALVTVDRTGPTWPVFHATSRGAGPDPGHRHLSKSQVSGHGKSLDGMVDESGTGPWTAVPTYSGSMR